MSDTNVDPVTGPSAAPGWYGSPTDPDRREFWDGSEWRSNLKCGSCGSILGGDICASCGARNAGGPLVPSPSSVQIQPKPSEEKSVGLAIFLNFIFPGAGHLYAGVKTEFGIIFTVISGVNLLLSFTLIWILIGLPLWIVCAVWTMVDVNREMKIADASTPGVGG